MPTRHRIGIFFFRRLSRSRSQQTAALRCRGKTHKKGILVCQTHRGFVAYRQRKQIVGFMLLQQCLPLARGMSFLSYSCMHPSSH